MLYDPARHEPLSAPDWSAAAARHAIDVIVRDIELHRQPGGGWPVHPLDSDGSPPPGGHKSLDLGRAGVLWALWWLQQQGAAAHSINPLAGLQQALLDYRSAPDGGSVVPSYLAGESGILWALWQLGHSNDVADRLFEVVRSNIGHPANESLWGAPGSMMAAWHLWAATQEPRWRQLFLDNVDALWRHWHFDEPAGCHLWTQDLYGQQVQYFGAGHGLAGNVGPLLKGAALLDEERRQALVARCAQAFVRVARVDADAANWRGGTYMPRSGKVDLLLQWCHGAPGIITSLADLPVGRAPALDALLLAGGQAIWRAGPLTKGPGLCHGTAGNGQAFLVLYQRTGHALWLDRARAFAMHAVGQAERLRLQHGRGRHTLWTGDAGLAVFLWQCIEARAGMPLLDFVR